MTSRQKSKLLIDVQNIHYQYESRDNPVSALEDINIKIHEGEFICLLGPSGCGKTTLLNILAGYIKPTEGTCLMEGEPIDGPDWRRGVVFQSPTLYPWLSVKENVEFGPKMKGLSPEERDAISRHYLEQVGLSGFESQPVFELSGGMKQRASLARALANEPEVILMDEPFGALDAITRLNMQEMVRGIWSKNANTIFMITHDIDEALALGTRVLIMSKRPGRIIQEYSVDYTDHLLENPSGYAKFDDDYYALKQDILALINKH